MSTRLVIAAVAVTATLTGTAAVAATRPHPPGAAANERRPAGPTYFVDCASGSDAASGLAPDEAWRSLGRVNAVTFPPGASVLFRRGTRCDGVFEPSGSGTADAPILAGAYGSGPKPRLAGDGARAAVYLHNVAGWELRDLDISDLGPLPQPGTLRTAISVVNDSLGVAEHFVIADDDIHDVNSSPVPDAADISDFENYSKVSGGVEFASTGGNGFDDVTVEDNTLTAVDREGMYISAAQPTTGLVVRDNTLRDIGGDGIVAVNSTNALIEHNLVDGFNEQGSSFNAGVWAYASTGDVFQFNDVSHGQHGPLDTMAYDIDGSNFDLVFQYNFSHDNTGGFLMLCNNASGVLSTGAPNGGSVVRYNISQNDSAVVRAVIDAPFACATEQNIRIYNNTVYTKDPRVTTLVENTNSSTAHFMNNILVGPGVQAQINDAAATWSNNLYLDVSCGQRPPDPHAVVADPRFVDPGTATSGADATGYELTVGSPAIGAGQPVADNGGRDYFGDPVPQNAAPDIGAYQGPGVTPQPSDGSPVPQVPLAPLCGSAA